MHFMKSLMQYIELQYLQSGENKNVLNPHSHPSVATYFTLGIIP
jgi:hypothetical protein